LLLFRAIPFLTIVTTSLDVIIVACQVIVIVAIVAYSRLSLLACGIACFWLLPIHGLRLLVAINCSWLLPFTCGNYCHYLLFK
jgi:hypothetical protein